ncbi:MAG: hypothetical protein FJZ89_00350 [Chloroflexi bacterium]|nr:hypothetical protein [Chloroflexota bacterium]
MAAIGGGGAGANLDYRAVGLIEPGRFQVDSSASLGAKAGGQSIDEVRGKKNVGDEVATLFCLPSPFDVGGITIAEITQLAGDINISFTRPS